MLDWQALAAHAMVVFLAIHPPFMSDDRMDKVKDLCRELGVLCVDSVTNGMWGDRKLMSDNIHPSAAGYRVMAERVHDALAGRPLTLDRPSALCDDCCLRLSR